MTRSWSSLAGITFAVAILACLAPASVLAADPTFGQPTATAELGEPITFSSTIDGVATGTVEVLVNLVGRDPRLIIPAQSTGSANEWGATAALDVPSAMECACFANGQSAPNSKIEYRFRVRAADGTVTFGPDGQITVEDKRFQWQHLDDRLVHVHWYDGDQAFAQAAANVANNAIDRAAELLGSTLPVPVDLFVYSTQEALLEAVSPGRENIAGEAHSNIATMFVWIPPTQDPSESAVTVAHELTHLVFNEVTFNPFHGPPRWLNEGIATYLSEGYSADYRAIVTVNAANGTLFPLDGIAGFFPSPRDPFILAYGESVAAVDYFVRTYSEETLWDLVRSYAEGVSDDDAFRGATGADVAAFNEAWLASIGSEVPEPFGPQPAPPGPIPSDWNTTGQPTTAPRTLAPGETPGPVITPAPNSTPGPGQTARPQTPRPSATPPPADAAGDDTVNTIAIVLLLLVAIIFGVLILVVVIRARTRRPPPPPYQQPPWQY